MTAARAWFLAASTGAPAALRERAGAWLDRQGNAGLPAALEGAAAAALRAALGVPGDRDAALDLLAADALVTLALQAAAAADPAGIAGHARRLREAAAR